MLKIVIEVDAPGWAAQGVKEHLAMCLERFGDVRVVGVHNNARQKYLERVNSATDEQPLECQAEMEEGP